MEKISTLILCLFIGFTSVIAQNTTEPSSNTVQLKFDTTTFSFGEIVAGPQVEGDYHFTNIGNTPLTIKNVTTGCTCLVPYWPKGEIKPGQAGTISLVFLSWGQEGKQDKKVTVITTADVPKMQLEFKGSLIAVNGQ
jgi:hypothetical protein